MTGQEAPTSAATEPIGGEKTMGIWTDVYNVETDLNEVGFLVRVENQNHAGCPEHFVLRRRPQHTNRSHEPRLYGWCGTNNNVASYAEGLAKMVRTTANERALLMRVPQKEQAAALEELGYPGLETE